MCSLRVVSSAHRACLCTMCTMREQHTLVQLFLQPLGLLLIRLSSKNVQGSFQKGLSITCDSWFSCPSALCEEELHCPLCCFFFSLQLGWSGRKGQWSDNVVVAHCWLLFVGVTGMLIFLCCNLSFRIIFPSPLLLFFTLCHVIVVPMLAWASAYSLSPSFFFFFADSGTNMEKKIKKKHSLDLGLLYVT